MSNEKITINRPLVGLIAMVCLGTAVAFWILSPAFDKTDMWKAGFTRVGLVMGALWLALPTKGREAAWANVSPWTLTGMILAVIGIATKPKVAIPIVLFLAVVGFFLRPRGKKRPPTRS